MSFNPRRLLPALGLVLLVAAARLSGAAAAPAGPDEPAPEFFIQSWTTENGLPHNAISCLAVDRKKYLWLGTPGGLSRFDGLQFDEVAIPPEHQHGGFNIRALAVQDSGALLLLPTSGEILQWDAGRFRVHPASASCKGRQPTALFQAADQALWIYFSEGDLLRWTATGEQRFSPSDGSLRPGGHVSFADDDQGGVWVSIGRFVGRYANGRIVAEPLLAAGPAALAASAGGGMWICAPNEAIRCRGAARDHFAFATPDTGEKPFESVLAACEDPAGRLWIAAGRKGLFSLHEGRLASTTLPSVYVASVNVSAEGDLWLGTNGHGLMQLRRKNYRLFNARAGLVENVSNSVAGDRQGGVWLSNNRGGLYEVGGAVPRHVTVNHNGKSLDVGNVAFDLQGNLWCGGGEGLFRQSPAFSGTVEKLPVPTRSLALLHCTSRGDVWFAAHDGSFGFYRAGVLKNFSAADGYDGQAIRTLCEGPDGRVWAGTFAGDLYVYADDRLQKFAVGDPVHDILFDDRGDMWVATAAGLLRKTETGFQKFTRAQGLADDILGRLLQDERGNLWMSSRRGFFLVALEELRALAAGKISSVRSIPFGRDQGLAGLAALHNYSPSSYKSRDGRLWFATASGVVAIDPKPSVERAAPEIFLDAVHVNDVAVNPTGVIIPPGPHRIEFKFSVPSYGDAESVRVRYQLHGADPGWKEALKAREVTYSGLAPGRYRFQLQSGNASGVWNPLQPEVAFVVERAWWQEPWLWAAGTLATALLALVCFRHWSQRQLRRRLQALERENYLERERVRIARDLHDDLGGSITAINLLAERLRHTASTERTTEIALLGERSRSLSAELHNIIWMMRPQKGSVTEFADYVQRYCDRFLASATVNLVVTCAVETDHALTTEIQHHIFSVVKEAVNNALKHSQATRIVIHLAASATHLEIKVEDNGRGFDPASPETSRGNGLQNIRARVAEIGADVTIASSVGEGTRLTLLLPLSPAS